MAVFSKSADSVEKSKTTTVFDKVKNIISTAEGKVEDELVKAILEIDKMEHGTEREDKILDRIRALYKTSLDIFESAKTGKTSITNAWKNVKGAYAERLGYKDKLDNAIRMLWRKKDLEEQIKRTEKQFAKDVEGLKRSSSYEDELEKAEERRDRISKLRNSY
jgi:hypothetical protein